MEAPYQDAAGQGLMVTMFYPLWDKQANDFAGAVGADITLNKIVENVLTTRVAKTGFAFLTNSQGEIIAMPEVGHKLFDVNLAQTELGGLTYYSGSLKDSTNPRVQELAAAIVANPEGVLTVNLGDGTSQADEYMIAYDSLPALANAQYEDENWRIVVAAPSAEIFAVLNQTGQAINERSLRLTPPLAGAWHPRPGSRHLPLRAFRRQRHPRPAHPGAGGGAGLGQELRHQPQPEEQRRDRPTGADLRGHDPGDSRVHDEPGDEGGRAHRRPPAGKPGDHTPQRPAQG